MSAKADAPAPPLLEKPPGTHKSVVWEHFGFPVRFDDGFKHVCKDETCCRVCHARLKYTGSTTNMTTHIRRHHPNIDISGATRSGKKTKPVTNFTKSQTDVNMNDQSHPAPVGQLRLQEAFKNKLPAMSTRARAITRSIGMYMALDMRPYSVVENVGYRNMLQTLEPRYEIPSRTHFANTVVPGLYANTRDHVLETLKNACSLALTTDGWTSRACESYVTITAHYITAEWMLENPVLQTRPLHESHTGSNLANVLIHALEEWKVDIEKFETIPVCTDNASNIVSAVKKADGLSPHIRCFAHTINLASQRAMNLPAMSRILGRVKRVVSFFHRSPTANHLFKKKQQLLDLPDHSLIQDVSTRWNSSYDMLERYLEQQAAVFATLTMKDIRHSAESLITLSDDDISAIEDTTKVLKPLKTITTILCSESLPTVSLILPMKQMIMKSMAVLDTDSNIIKGIKKSIFDDLKPRYTEDGVVKFLEIATALDPRFRSMPYHNDGEKLRVYAEVANKTLAIATKEKMQMPTVKQEPGADPPLPDLPVAEPSTSQDVTDEPAVKVKCESEQPTSHRTHSAMDELFGDVFITQVEKAKPLSQLVEEEVRLYKTEECIPLASSPLEWWKYNQYKFRYLSKLAKVYLNVPGTSVPSERVFSTAGDIVSAQRACLTPDNVDKLIFLKKNLKFFL